MESGMVIRECTQGDLAGLLALYTQLHHNPAPQMTDSLRQLWADILHDRRCHLIVGCADGRIVSSCTVVIIPNLTHGQRPYALIENVVTDERCRGRGFATALLQFAQKIAVDARCYKIMLMTGSKEQSTLRFYEKAGYNRRDKTAFIQWLD